LDLGVVNTYIYNYIPLLIGIDVPLDRPSQVSCARPTKGLLLLSHYTLT